MRMAQTGFCALVFMFVLAAGVSNAQTETTDQQLLSAQNAYQQALSQQTKARNQLKNAQDKLNAAQGRLNEAQQAVQHAQSEVTTAQSAQTATDSAMDQATTNLRAAWERKGGGRQ